MKMTKMTALLLAAAMALTACGSTAAVSSEAAASAAAAPAAAETAVTYPLTITDQLGREVTIETEPKTPPSCRACPASAPPRSLTLRAAPR